MGPGNRVAGQMVATIVHLAARGMHISMHLRRVIKYDKIGAEADLYVRSGQRRAGQYLLYAPLFLASVRAIQIVRWIVERIGRREAGENGPTEVENDLLWQLL
jgi:hypothetical protein